MSSSSDKTHPDNKKFSGEGWQDLSEKKRHCTDCMCLVGVAIYVTVLLLDAQANFFFFLLLLCVVVDLRVLVHHDHSGLHRVRCHHR